jgi:hypothetical protein
LPEDGNVSCLISSHALSFFPTKRIAQKLNKETGIHCNGQFSAKKIDYLFAEYMKQVEAE